MSLTQSVDPVHFDLYPYPGSGVEKGIQVGTRTEFKNKVAMFISQIILGNWLKLNKFT